MIDHVVRVLVVDDSAYVRKVLQQILQRSPFIEVVGAARNGAEALELTAELRPDVITLDLMMPEMDGLAFLQAQMPRRRVPVIVVSTANEASEQVLKALDAGALDFVQKPTALANEKILAIADELLSKIKALARAPSAAPAAPASPAPAASAPRAGAISLIAIGISTGGPQALKQLIPQLPANFRIPIAIVMHMPVGYTEMYARALNELAPLQVVEAGAGVAVQPGTVLLAPAGQHLSLHRRPGGQVVSHLSLQPIESLHRPSVDVLFQSAADVYQEHVLGIIMTGMGSDGQHGAAWIKASGGTIWTEAEESCVVYGMPRAVVEAGLSDRSVPLAQMAQLLQEVA